MKNTIELGLETWREMDWSLILKAIKGEATRPAIRQPYNYQQPAVDAAQQYFKTETRGRLIMPCATGKSLIGFWIGQKLKAKNIIVVVPSLGLLRQTVAEWAREFYAYDQKPDWICVCSDEAVGNLKKDETVGEVYQTALPTDTDPREIAKELRRGKGPKIVFVTYHSSSRLAKAARLARFKFDLIIFDEAHRTAGPRYRQFATLLHDGMLRAHCRVFMTATERKVNGDAEVCSMDDNEEDYGKRFFTMSYKEAIRLDAIVDYKILTVAVSEARIAELIATNRLLKHRPRSHRNRGAASRNRPGDQGGDPQVRDQKGAVVPFKHQRRGGFLQRAATRTQQTASQDGDGNFPRQQRHGCGRAGGTLERF
jgi:predicted helicase